MSCSYLLIIFCPNLEIVRVTNCSIPSSEGIWEIINGCSSTLRDLDITLRDLDITLLENVSNIFGSGDLEQFTMPNLTVLNASKTGINDEVMAMIGKRCPHLQLLNISCCQRVTNKGVKEVVRNCKKLRGIVLFGCKNVSTDIVSWMVVSRPSLKNIVLPNHS